MRATSISHVAAAVRGRRQDIGLSQGELSKRAGVSRRWLITFEAGGSTHVELGTVMRVLDALGLALDLRPLGRTGPRPTATPAVAAETGAGPDAIDLDAVLDDLRRG